MADIDAKAKELLAGMEGVTDGLWHVAGATHVYASGPRGGNVCTVGEPRATTTVEYTKLEFDSNDDEEAYSNAAYIARCSPDNLRPILEAYLSQAETIAELRKALDDLSEPSVKSFKMENGAFDIALTGPVVERIAVAMVGHFKANGAENYVEMSLYDREEPYQRYCVTVQKVGAKSPHDLRREAEAALARAAKEGQADG